MLSNNVIFFVGVSESFKRKTLRNRDDYVKVSGGVHLVKSPEEITLLEILETMEGPISVVGCVHSPAQCRRNELCPTRDIWVQLNAGIRELTRQITLEDILNTYQRHDAENGIFDYCI